MPYKMMKKGRNPESNPTKGTKINEAVSESRKFVK
jgi:hypothetical protein